MNWNRLCAYDEAQKRRFHAAARIRLRQLALALHLPGDSFDLRSNRGGIAVSAEVTLHHERIYIQASQPAFGGDRGGAGQGPRPAQQVGVAGVGVLIRTCRSRRDHVGGPNHFVSLAMLDDVDALADRVRRIVPDLGEATAA